MEKVIEQTIIQGKHPREASRILKTLVNKHFENKRYAAERIAITESARVQSSSQKLAFEEFGVEQYEFIAETDSKTCSVCGDLDGKVFNVSGMRPGENAAPMHPNCRCSVAAKSYRKKLEETFKIMDREDALSQGTSLTLDSMSRGKLYVFDEGGQDLRIRAKPYDKTPHNVWIQRSGKTYRDTADMISSYIDKHQELKKEKFVVADLSKRGGIAAYDRNLDMFVLSTQLNSKRAVTEALKSGYHAARTFGDIIIHEVAHKMHWKAAERLYKTNPKQYNSIEEAKGAIDAPIIKFVKDQKAMKPDYISRISINALDAFEIGNVNELVADIFVLDNRNEADPYLVNLVKEALNHDIYSK